MFLVRWQNSETGEFGQFETKNCYAGPSKAWRLGATGVQVIDDTGEIKIRAFK